MDPSTARMRVLGRGQRQGMHLVEFRMTEAQIEALVRNGYLEWQLRNNVIAVNLAAEAWLADALARSGGGRDNQSVGGSSQSS
jgi:hypothetical protein